jgi:hypothetical protein
MPRSRGRALLAMLSMLGTIALAGCLTPWPPTQTAAIAAPPPVASDPKPQVCSVWKLVRYSKDDTPDTIEQIREDNAAWHSLCDK